MKSYKSIYFLLLVLVIVGAFASMAQNTYGMTILGLAAASYSLLFFYRMLSPGKKKKTSRLNQAELFCLALLTLVIALRIFNIHGRATEMIFVSAGLALAAIYLWKMKKGFEPGKPMPLAIIIPVYYLSIALFLLSMISFGVLPIPSFILTLLALIAAIAFIAIAVLKQDVIIEGEHFSAFSEVLRIKDQSLIVISFFFLFSFHTALSNFGILPKLYSDQFPQAYYQLLRNAETGKEMSVNGKFRHDEFKKEYNRFVERQFKN